MVRYFKFSKDLFKNSFEINFQKKELFDKCPTTISVVTESTLPQSTNILTTIETSSQTTEATGILNVFYSIILYRQKLLFKPLFQSTTNT